MARHTGRPPLFGGPFPFWVAVAAFALAIYDLGFGPPIAAKVVWGACYTAALAVGVYALVWRALQPVGGQVRYKVLLSDLAAVLLLSAAAGGLWGLFDGVALLSWWGRWLVYPAVGLMLIREFAALRIDLKRSVFNPAQLFILSFLALILLGGLLLMLPRATVEAGISFTDAMFTSASAVCVTGLAVVDTGSHFTLLGQGILMLLMQAGGLGVMTFASYFAYFFQGGASYENQLTMRDVSNVEKLGEVFGVLKRIIIVSFLVEFIGFLAIYASVWHTPMDRPGGHLFFAAFHAVSAFCNAGFSTLSNSLHEEGYRFNYPLHLSVAALFTIGGLGFPIVFNLLRYVRYAVARRLSVWLGRGVPPVRPWVITLNARIVLITSLVLTVAGTVVFFILEYDRTLAEHSVGGKLVTAFFGAATTRTAGFNTVDTSALRFSTIMVVFLLMWIGASPASTGGGIKTSTFAVAMLNILSLAQGKTRVEVWRREIAAVSVQRAFAIMTLSLLVIGAAVCLMAFFEDDKNLLDLAFECFSAYSTVGLSLGLTAELSTPSRWIIIAVMFIGRVSMMSILIAALPKVRQKNYQYPTEEILIN